MTAKAHTPKELLAGSELMNSSSGTAHCIWSSMPENACFSFKAFLISTALT